MDNPSNLSIKKDVKVSEVLDAIQKKDSFSVRHKVFVEEQKVPPDLEADLHDQDGTTIHFVAYNQSVPVGAARLRQYTDEVGKVERVAVLKEARGLGIGFSIMNELESVALRKGYRKLILNSQLHAQDFYERLGFQPKGDIFHEANIPHVAMEKELD